MLVELSEEDRATLVSWTRKGSGELRRARRATIVLGLSLRAPAFWARLKSARDDNSMDSQLVEKVERGRTAGKAGVPLRGTKDDSPPLQRWVGWW